MVNKRPLGITLLGNFLKWTGVLGFLGALFFSVPMSFSSPTPARILENIEKSGSTLLQYRIGSISFLIGSVIGFFMGCGLLSLKMWARKGTIYLFAVSAVVSMLLQPFSPRLIPTLAWYIGIIYYLSRPQLKAVLVDKGLDGIFWF